MIKRRSILLLCLTALFMPSCSDNPTASSARTPAPVAQPENAANPQIKIVTTEGEITAELYADKSPISTENFLKYVDKKHYDNTIFHRVIKGFMIQGGGFGDENGNFVEKETLPPIKNEYSNGLKNRRATLAMARTSDIDSATSQFFINTEDNAEKLSAKGGYAVFGKVLAGMEVVDAIEASATAKGMLTSLQAGTKSAGSHENVPVKKIVITSITKIK